MLLKKDHPVVGLILGAAFPIVTYALFMMLAERTPIKLDQEFTDILCVGSNLPIFYYYLNRFMYKTVKGIVVSSIILAVVYMINHLGNIF
jgi:hypothetical protein